jgi:hypothetical protein
MARVRYVVLSAALMGCLCACATSTSGKGSEGSPAPHSAASSASSASASASSAASSTAPAGGGGPVAAALPALVVQAADVPGLTGDGSASAVSKSDSDDPQTSQCLGLPDPDQYFLAEYESDEFSTDSVTVDSDITSYTSSQAVTIDRETIAEPDKLATCFKQDATATDSGLPTGTTVDSIDVDAPPAGAPANVLGVVAVQLTIPDEGKGYVDDVLIVGKYVDESVTFTSTDPIPASMVTPLVTTIGNRISGK